MTREQLLPQDVLQKIPRLYSNEKTPVKEKMIWVRYFLASFTWLVAECRVQKDDVLFFGCTISPHGSEWGYFTLSQLAEIKIPNIPEVECDMYFKECTFEEYSDQYKERMVA